MITIKEAARLYETKQRNVLYWIKQHKITYSKIGNTYFVDEIELGKIIARNIRWSHYADYLEEETRIREDALTNALMQIDDLIFLFKSVKKVSPLLLLLIDEMTSLISHENRKTIFIGVLSGKSISAIAQECGIPFDKACYLYNSALKELKSKAGFLRTYRKNLLESKLATRKLEIENQNLKEYINKVNYFFDNQKKNDNTSLQVYPVAMNNIPWECVRVLSLNVMTTFDLDERVINGLRGLGIVTIEDLIRFIRNKGFNSFGECRNIGKKSLNILKDVLMKNGIIDESGYSYLFKYIEPVFVPINAE